MILRPCFTGRAEYSKLLAQLEMRDRQSRGGVVAIGSQKIEQQFSEACDRFCELGVDAQAALADLAKVPISVQCWQGDDVAGFEDFGQAIGGGLAVTGHYPGRATTPDQLRSDLGKAYSLIPGRHRLNLHASYGEFGGRRIERDEILVEHFQGWIDWADEHHLGLDFNPTFFAHEKAAEGFTLAHPDPAIRRFWIEHGIRARRIGAAMGAALGTACVTNVWIPDGFKDSPVDRLGPRQRLLESLDAMFAEQLDQRQNHDAVESKLFGLGSESCVVGSHEFYLGYAISRQKVLCLDAGHFHPTEVISDKLSAVLLYVPRLLLHVSRPVRWDSDHVVTLNEELVAIATELVRGGFLGRTHVGLDFFDASINRIAAWVIGTRNMLKAMLIALLAPSDMLRDAESAGDYTMRLALQEETKTLPYGAVWDYYCQTQDTAVGMSWLDEVRRYENSVLTARD